MKKGKLHFKTIPVLLLALTLCFTATLAVACGSDSSSSSSSSSTEDTTYPTDYQTLSNGDFEFSTFTKENKDFPVSSSISWTQSRDSITTSATSSSYGSGIIDTADDAYKAIAETAGFHKIGDASEYYNPRTPYYYGLVEKTYEYDENTDNEDKLPTKGSKILMIHNEVTANPGEGTAQKFTSSTSLTLARNEYAAVSVWVNTFDLKTKMDTKDFGAYISVLNTVSTSLSPLVIKNIDTKGSWVKYTVYLSSSDFATSSFKIVLGLGFGSSKIKQEYVEGFAYFDNITYTSLTKKEYADGIATIAAENKFDLYTFDAVDNVYAKTEANDLKVNRAGKTYTDTSAYEKSDEYKADNAFSEIVYSLSHTRENKYNESVYTLQGGTLAKNEVLAGNTPNATAQGITSLSDAIAACDDELKAPDDSLNATKAAYVLLNDPSSYTYTTPVFPVKANGYIKLSFWVKVQLKDVTFTGLTITLDDIGKNKTDSTTTQVASNVNTNKYENENYNGWCQYVVYVSNTITETDERYFKLSFDFGPTTAGSTDHWKLASGYMIIAGLDGYEMTENDYSIADTSTYTYSKKVALSADMPNGAETENTDSYNFTYGTASSIDVKNNVAENVVNYTGVVGNSEAVGGTNETAYVQEGTKAGVVNTEYLDAYVTSGLITADEKTEIGKLGKLNTTNKYAQPLFIKNENALSYGYYGQSASFAANTTTLISVRVKALAGAVANVYLVNADALDRFEILALSARKYTYDADKKTVVYNDDYAVSEHFNVSVVASDTDNYADDGWFTVMFCITTGNEAVSYRVELWNGARDGSANSKGVVLFDNYKVESSYSADTLKTELEANYNDAEAAKTVKYTRVPTLVTYTDDNGDEATKYTTYKEDTVYSSYAHSKAVIATYATIDAVTEIDNTTSSDTGNSSISSSSSATSETSFSWALQITSIIIAGVLIALLIVILVKMIVDKAKKNKGASVSYYNRDSREEIHEKIAAKKAKETENKPYDYDNPENNVADNDEPADESDTAEETQSFDNADGDKEEAAQPETKADETDDDKPADDKPAEKADTPDENK